MNHDIVIPISALEHHLYCPRQCALIHVDGLWFDNEHTVRGTAGHHRVDTDRDRRERQRRVIRHLPLWSEELGLSGRGDAVEVDDDGAMAPVEYKIGSAHGMAAMVQLCAQALCLEEMAGRPVPVGFIWYTASRQRVRVAIDDALRATTREAIEEIRAWMAAPRLPPAANDRRCRSCQFLDNCLPELAARPDAVLQYLLTEVQCGT